MIEVEGPDGTIYEVNTDDETVARETVRKHLAKTAPAAPRQPSGLDKARAVAAGATDTATSGFIDEAAGNAAAAAEIVRQSQRAASQGGPVGAVLQGIRGGAAPVEAFVRGIAGSDTEAMRQAREGRTQAVRDDQAALKAQSPGFYTGGQIAGGVAQAVVPVGRAAQGARALQRAGAAAGSGALLGGLYGLGSGTTAQERLTSGATGAAVGGVVGGAVSPVADLVGASPLAGRVQEAVAGIPDAIGRTFRGMTNPANVNRGVGMTIGPPPMGAGAAQAGARPARATGDSIARRLAQLADRNRMAPDELPGRIQQMQADPRGQVVAEAFGEPGVMSAATVARMPGQTRSLATELMEARNAGQARRLERDLTGQAEQGAVDFFQERTQDVAERIFNPVWQRPRMQSPLEDQRALDAFRQRPSVQAAEADARENMAELIARGELPGDALDDPARVLHYIKIQIADAISNPMKPGSSAKNLSRSNLEAAVRDISNELERLRPGYAQAMREFQAAIGPRELAKRMASVRGESPNVAANFARNPDIMRDIERLGLNDFGRAITEESRLYRNANRMTPSWGTQTTPLALGALDEMAAGGAALPTTKQGALTWLADRVSSPIQESRRNELGRTLFSDVSEIDPVQLQRIQDELRRITELRAARARGAAAAGGATGSTASNRTR